MFRDARELPHNTQISTHICIIGAGAAGITLANELIGSGLNVLLLESGDFVADSDKFDLNRGDIVGLPYFPLEACRLRFFGGTTNHWGGWCKPPESHDFLTRSWIPYSGWPFSLNDLFDYYRRGHLYCDLGEYNYDPNHWISQELPLLKFDNEVFSNVMVKFSPPTRFGQKFQQAISTANNIDLLLNADALSIEVDTKSNNRVAKIRCGTLAGNRFSVKAKHYVLAMGGIENARILLLSKGRNGESLGNKDGLVGRFFSDSFVTYGGDVIFSDPTILLGHYEEHLIRNQRIKGYLQLSREMQEKLQTTTITYTLDPVPVEKYDRASRTAGVESFNQLSQQLVHGKLPNDITLHMKNILADLDSVAVTAFRKLRYGKPPVSHYRLLIGQDCAPNPDSRVTLSDDIDAYGLRRVQLDWKITDLDFYSFNQAQQIFAQELGRSGLGRMRIQRHHRKNWPSTASGVVDAGWHHNGTTRMHDSPSKGVVDSDCRLHEANNLYVLGSSVFPTYEGQPTLTIVALSIRLADHIKSIFA